jgi:hypothetical protein
LFQRITATVQKAEYRSAAYEQSAKLVQGSQEEKQAFI